MMMKTTYQTRFQVVADALRNEISSGRLKQGDKLPSEQALAEEFEVSRATLREAIGLLVSEGFIIKRHGVGNFVGEMKLQSGLETLQSTTAWITQSGYHAGTLSKKAVVRPADASELEQLELGWAAEEPVDEGSLKGQGTSLTTRRTTEVVEVSRIRTADGVPIIYSVDRIPSYVFENPDLACKALLEEESLLAVLESNGVSINDALASVTPMLPSQELRTLLNLDARIPLLWLKQVHYTVDGKPLLLSDIYIHPDKLETKVVRKWVTR